MTADKVRAAQCKELMKRAKMCNTSERLMELNQDYHSLLLGFPDGELKDMLRSKDFEINNAFSKKGSKSAIAAADIIYKNLEEMLKYYE